MGDTVQRRYSGVAMALHWAIAAGVIWNWWAAEFTHGPQHRAFMGTHKAVGITILVLTVVRIGWRLAHPRPPLPAGTAAWERWLAKGTWAAFYILLVSLPMLGWIASSLGDRPISMFGLFDWPLLPLAGERATAGWLFDIHATLGSATMLLLLLHVAGALKHTVIDRDGGLARMLPFGTVRG